MLKILLIYSYLTTLITLCLYIYLFLICFNKARIQEFEFNLMMLRESMRFMSKVLLFPFMGKK